MTTDLELEIAAREFSTGLGDIVSLNHTPGGYERNGFVYGIRRVNGKRHFCINVEDETNLVWCTADEFTVIIKRGEAL